MKLNLFKQLKKMETKKKLPAVVLFQNKKNGNILLISQCRNASTGALTDSDDPPITIMQKEYFQNITKHVLDALANFKDNIIVSGLPDYLKPDPAKFKRNHNEVLIYFISESEVHIAPMKRVRGGAVGDKENIKIYQFEEFKTNLPQIILKVFESFK